MSTYLVISENNMVDEKLFLRLKEITEQDSTATFSIVDRSNLPIAEFWADEKVKAYARKQAVESMAKLEKACAPLNARHDFPMALPNVQA